MKRLLIIMVSAVICLFICINAFASEADPDTAFSVKVYNTEGEGLTLKASPDINSARLLIIPENTPLGIDKVSEGWGHTVYNGQTGWVALRYTLITGNYTAKAPSSVFNTAADCRVSGTGNEGLELRAAPTVDSSSYGSLAEGTAVQIKAIEGKWAYTWYNNNYGWINITYLKNLSFNAMVYDTDNEGLALKTSADINSQRLCLIPENTVISIDQISGEWGHTSYSGMTGWVALRYTMTDSRYIAESPTEGFIDPINYTVVNTENEGLELRTAPTGQTSTYGPVPEGSLVRVEAISGKWAYASYSGIYGWLYTDYLYNGSFEGRIYNTDNEGLSLKTAADINSARILTIPENTTVLIDLVSGSWGYTTYNGSSGWISLRYVKVPVNHTSEKPQYGFIDAAKYTVFNTGSEGLQLRTAPTVESCTYGAIPDRSVITVEAVEGSWAYAEYNNVKGWVYTDYIRK